MIKNIVFDLDGVLFDGREFHAMTFLKAVSIVLPTLNLTKEYHDVYLDGLSTKEKLKRLDFNDDITRRIYDIKQELTAKTINNYIQSDKKVIDMCNKLIKLGYKLFCVSNSIRLTVEVCLEGIGVKHLFTGIISNQDTTETKPSPEPYLTLYRNYKLEPKECLIVEDSPHGIESAINSGGNILPVKYCADVTLDIILNKVSEIENYN